ncbi:hypothetical protein [Paenibacillus sp. P3E]|nr:hypothetical protein [Paenibacillus sp. P3E]
MAKRELEVKQVGLMHTQAAYKQLMGETHSYYRQSREFCEQASE